MPVSQAHGMRLTADDTAAVVRCMLRVHILYRKLAVLGWALG